VDVQPAQSCKKKTPENYFSRQLDAADAAEASKRRFLPPFFRAPAGATSCTKQRAVSCSGDSDLARQGKSNREALRYKNVVSVIPTRSKLSFFLISSMSMA
jgi:hypothetical protein